MVAPNYVVSQGIHHSDTPSCDTGIAKSPDHWSEPVADTGPAVETAPIGTEFASDVVHCIAKLCGGRSLEDPLGLCFGLSAWMKRHCVGLEETVDAILRLRTALLSVSGLDASSEPVPLRVPDRVVFVVNLAVYLDGLLGRAAGVLGVTPGEAADAAVESLLTN